MQSFVAADVVYTPPRRRAHQAGARRPRDRRPDDPGLELPAEPRLARRVDRRAAHPRRRRPRRGRAAPRPSRRRRACTATALLGRDASATSRCRPATPPPTASPASSDVTFNVKIANQGENNEQDVAVKVTVRGGGKTITAQKTVDQTTPGAETTVAVPLGQAPPIGVGVKITVEVRKVPGEDNVDEQQGRVPGDLPPQLIAAGRRPPPSPSRLPFEPMGAELSSTVGIVALAASALALAAVCLCIVLFRQLRQLRADQRAVLGEQQEQDLVAHAAALDASFRDAAGLRPRRGRAARRPAGGRRAAPRRRDRAHRPHPLRRLQRDVRAPVDVDRAARQPRAPAWCSPRSTTATRLGCTPSRCPRARASCASRPRRRKPSASRCRSDRARGAATDAARLPRAAGDVLGGGRAVGARARATPSSSRCARSATPSWPCTTGPSTARSSRSRTRSRGRSA